MAYLEEMNNDLLEINLKLRREEVQLKEQIDDNVFEIQHLKSEKTEISNSLNTLTTKLKDKQTELTDLENKVFKYKNALDILYMSETYESEYKERKESLDKLSKDCSIYTDKLEKVKEEHDSLNKAYIELKNQYDYILNDIEFKRGNLKNVLSKIDSVSSEVKLLEKQLITCTQNKSNTEHELNLLSIRKNKLTAECKDMLRVNKSLKEEINQSKLDAKNVIEDMVKTETEKLNNQLDKLRNDTTIECDMLKRQAKEEADKIHESTLEQLKETNQEILTLTENINNLKSHKTILEEEKSVIVSEIERVTADLELLNVKDAQLRESISQLTDVLVEQDIRYKVEKLEVDIEDLTTFNKILEEKNAHLSSVIVEKDAEIKELRREKAEYSDKALSDEITKSKYTIEQLQANLKVANEQIALLKGNTTDSELKQEIKKLKKELKNASTLKETPNAPAVIVKQVGKDRKHEIITLGTVSAAVTVAYAMQTFSTANITDIVLVACGGGVIANTVYVSIRDFIKNKIEIKNANKERVLNMELENAALEVANLKKNKKKDTKSNSNKLNTTSKHEHHNKKDLNKRKNNDVKNTSSDVNADDVKEIVSPIIDVKPVNEPVIEETTVDVEETVEEPVEEPMEETILNALENTSALYNVEDDALVSDAIVDVLHNMDQDSNIESNITAEEYETLLSDIELDSNDINSESIYNNSDEEVVELDNFTVKESIVLDEKSEAETEIEMIMKSILNGDDINLSDYQASSKSNFVSTKKVDNMAHH